MLPASAMETLPSTTNVTIICHMNNNHTDCHRWLLVKARNIHKINPLICHLSTVLGVDDETALQASSCWLNGKKVKIPPEGLVVDKATGLRVYRATSSPEIVGSNSSLPSLWYNTTSFDRGSAVFAAGIIVIFTFAIVLSSPLCNVATFHLVKSLGQKYSPLIAY